jgi:hypothetical protein
MAERATGGPAEESTQGAVESAPTPDEIRVTLWARRPVCGPRTTVINRLAALSAAGELASFAIETWPDEVPTGDEHNETLATVEQLEAWAAENAVSLRPPFETRTASLLVGDDEEVLVTPMLLIAVYADGELAGVYPCTDGHTTWTVEEFLDAVDPDAERTSENPALPDTVTAGG